MKRLVAIIDIDTTIANNDERAALLVKHCVVCGGAKAPSNDKRAHCTTCAMPTSNKVDQASWDTFLRTDLVALDTPVRKAQDVIKHWRSCGLEFHFLTGRDEVLREVTEQWLKDHFGWQPLKEDLYMRGPEHDRVPASKYKEEAFLKLKKARGLDDCIFLFCEDDPYVFRMFSKHGMCLRCPEGWEHFAPEAAPDVGHWQRR
jgi:hypothetical protein